MRQTARMTTLAPVSGVAFNPADSSENRIHSDDVARQYGFRGGLVPGVTVYAYLVEPALRAYGRSFLERGFAEVRLAKPVYDGHAYTVEVLPASDEDGATVTLLDDDGVQCAVGKVGLAREPGALPIRRYDPPAPAREARPDASREVLEALRESGLGSFAYEWTGEGQLARTAKDPADMNELVRPDAGGLANPSLSLGLANYALSNNVRLGPWIHVESRVRYHDAIPLGTLLYTEARILDLFSRGGHEFVDLDVSVFASPDVPVMSAWHRAIYQLASRA